ncbi:MAG TPA: GTPase HflX [Acetobacteraceae bacterium]|nr:GTPase HflX [Acetobacteraceae bacterium]
MTRAAVILPWERKDRDHGPNGADLNGPGLFGAGLFGAGLNGTGPVRAADARLEEAVGLAASIGLVVVHQAVLPLRARQPATLLGSGQVASLGETISELHVAVAIIDAALSPVQQRNLERAWHCKVIDRTALTLDIFGERAATREGTLQVELAHLAYQRSRLVRSWTHLERQRGGFGFLGGPGETQIEADRRQIDERLVRLKKDLQQVRRTRGLHRSARKRVPFPVVALVGYTNAGKSTLFNALTGSAVVARDQLFATLDPTMRGLILPSGRRIILSDTVGFISELPHELVEAFRATLEEVAEADIILHVRDAAHPETAAQQSDVLGVLADMERDGTLDPGWRSRLVEVMNKADLLGGVAEVPVRAGGVAVSAITGEGLDTLTEAIDRRIGMGLETADYDIDASDGARLAWLYRHGEVTGRRDDEAQIHVTVRLLPADRARFERRP